MRLGVVSDSHGNLEYLLEASNYLTEKFNVDYLIHLGDDYKDGDVFARYDKKVIRIPGVYDPEYRDRRIPHRSTLEVEGIKIILSHTNKTHKNDFQDDISPEEVIKNREVDIFLYGHSHLYEVRFEEGLLFVNPGHLKREDEKGNPSTFALLEIKKGRINVKIINQNKRIIFDEEFVKNVTANN